MKMVPLKEIIKNNYQHLPEEMDEESKAIAAALLVPAASGPYGKFRCERCGRVEGGTSALLRNVLHIEPMPELDGPIFIRKDK